MNMIKLSELQLKRSYLATLTHYITTTLKYILDGLSISLKWLRTVITSFIAKTLSLLILQIFFMWYAGMDLFARNPANAITVAIALAVAVFFAALWDADFGV
jgi:K+-sensing histidine kinase KdpD